MNQAKTKIGVIVILALLVVLVSVFVFAGKPEFTPAESKGGATVVVPAHAVEVAPGIFSLGTAQDVDGRTVEGYLFVDKKKDNAKPVCGNDICEGGEAKKCPADCGDGNGGPPVSSTCFSLFAKGAKWKETETYITGPGIDPTVTETSLETWDSEVPFEIFGARNASGVTDGADEDSPDGKNEVEFAPLGPTNTIAFTIVWGIFRGPPSGRELVEWDAVFNTNYTFGDATTSLDTVMDYQGVGTHEFGHAVGLTHPDDTCTEETMYRFIALNETKKRSLEAGDRAGVNELYS